MSQLAARLRAARLELGLTMVDVAERTGVHIQSVHRWETGLVRPDLIRLRGLASVLGRPVEWFLGGESPDGEVPEFARRAGVFLGFLGEVFRGVGLRLEASVTEVNEVGMPHLVSVQGLDPDHGDELCMVHVQRDDVDGVDSGRWRAAGKVKAPFLGGFGWGEWVVVVDIGRRELRDGAVFLMESGRVRSIVRCRQEGGWVNETMDGRVLLNVDSFRSSVWGEVVWIGGWSGEVVEGGEGGS